VCAGVPRKLKSGQFVEGVMAKQSTASKQPILINWVFRCNAEYLGTSERRRTKEGDALMGLLIDHCKAVTFQLESAPTTGYLHFQGAFQLLNKKRKFWILKNIFEFEYLAPMKGSCQQAFGYASKADTRILGPWVHGDFSEKSKPNEFAEYVSAIKNGSSNVQLWCDFPSMRARYPHVLVDYWKCHKPIRTDDLEVYVLFGKAGTGKTRAVKDMYPDAYVVPYARQGLWLTDDALGAKVVVLEDFDGNLPLKQFNRIIDRYPEQVESKFGHIWWCPIIIFLTTNTPVGSWYPDDGRQDTKEQIARRINWCFDFNTPEGIAMTEGITVQQLNERYPIGEKRSYPIFEYSSEREYKKLKLTMLSEQLKFYRRENEQHHFDGQ